MTNTTRMPWMKEDYTATKRAFRKKLGLFDKDVAIEEQARMEEEASENKNTMAWKDAIRIIQMLVNERDNKVIKRAWERILQG